MATSANKYIRKVDKSKIPTCNILGVNIAAINMEWLLKYLDENIDDIKGDLYLRVKCTYNCYQL